MEQRESAQLFLEATLPEKCSGRFWPSRSPTVREGSRSKFWKPELANARASARDSVLNPLTLFGQGSLNPYYLLPTNEEKLR
jgi:hypothetical protein